MSPGGLTSDQGYMSSGETPRGSFDLGPKTMPIDVVLKIMESTQNYELLQMLIKEITKNYEQLAYTFDSKKDGDVFMFHVHFVKKLSGRLHVNDSASTYNTLEKHLRASIEEHMCDRFLRTDRYSIKWITAPPTRNEHTRGSQRNAEKKGKDGSHSSHPIENKLSLLPIICKFGSQKTALNTLQNNDVNIIQVPEDQDTIE